MSAKVVVFSLFIIIFLYPFTHNLNENPKNVLDQ